MESFLSSSPMAGKSPPPRPPAIKRTLSNKSGMHVKFAKPTIGSFSGPLSPRSPLTERSSPRPEYRVALQRTISRASISSSLLKHQLNEVEEEEEGDTEMPLEVATEITINEPDGISTASGGCISSGSTGDVGQAESYAISEHDSTLSSSRTVGERSSARIPSPNVQDIEVLRNIMDTLRKHKIPGPQLFRVQTEFPRVLGFGGEGNVHGTDESIDNKINDLKLSNADKPKWKRFAIKRHGPRHGSRDEDQVFELKNYLAAAEAEISALSHLLRGHRNIVQLRGWGLCLDTLENTQNITGPPTELSSSNLHLPLIILERADGDLRQFLKHVFSDDNGTGTLGYSQESLVEAGHGQLPGNTTDVSPLNAYPSHPRPEQVSLSGSTLHGNDDDTTFRQYTTIVPELKESSHASEFWIINGMNRHEVLRRLCVDIGHGLQALHEMNMTHGDLKPRNVLVFREGPVWTAKLCDFGLSNDFDGSSPLDSSEYGAHYIGTFDWRPHWFGHKAKKHSIRTLQDFDLTVYGVLVWSAFSPLLRGKAPPISEEYHQSNPSNLFGEHLEEIAPKGCGQSMLGSKAALARRVNRLIQGTVCASYRQHKGSERGRDNSNWRLDERPWEQLYSHTVRATRSLWSRIPSSQQDAKYSGDGEHSVMEPSIKTTPSSTIEVQPCSRSKASDRLCDPRRYQVSHQTSSLLMAGNLCLPTYHETGEAYKLMGSSSDDLTLLHDNLLHLVRDVSEDPTKYALSLYSEARRRAAKAELNIWNSIPNRQNIVKLALECMPPLDIQTMAWLCRGEIGIEEVRNLPAEYSIWKTILEPGYLNESERLELFLLFMSFGARIEQILGGHPTMEEPRSILSMYLHSCRLSTRTAVASEICRHYGRILSSNMSEPHEPDATRYYMTAARRHRPQWTNDDRETVDNLTALGNVKLDKREHKGAYPFLKLNFEQLLDKHNDIYYQIRKRRPSRAADERTPLRGTHRPEVGSITTYNTVPMAFCNSLSSEPTTGSGLPPPTLKPSLPGWSECGNAFINELTRSITLKKPTVTLAQLRQISIGHIGSDSVLEIDMADFMLPMNSSSTSSPEPEDPYPPRQRIKKRFPFFDET